MREKKRNSYIELLRFIGAMIICMHHIPMVAKNHEPIATGGWILVEFYFLLTGYFVTAHFEEEKIEDEKIVQTAVFYTVKKVITIFPYYAIAIFIGFFQMLIFKEISIINIGNAVLDIIPQLFLLNLTGALHYVYCGPLWYISTFWIVMPIMILIIKKWNKMYRYYLCWVVPIIIYGILYTWHGAIQHWGEKSEFHCLLRAFAAMFLGSFVYSVSERMKKENFKNETKRILTVLEIILIIIVICYAILTDEMQTGLSNIMLMVFSLSLSFSDQTRTSQLFNEKLNWLGRISVPIYCIHYPIMEIISAIFENKMFWFIMLVSLLVTFVSSIILLYFYQKYWKKRIDGFVLKLKYIME